MSRADRAGGERGAEAYKTRIKYDVGHDRDPAPLCWRHEIARWRFLPFGTNDLTQTTWACRGTTRGGSPAYVERGLSSTDRSSLSTGRASACS